MIRINLLPKKPVTSYYLLGAMLLLTMLALGSYGFLVMQNQQFKLKLDEVTDLVEELDRIEGLYAGQEIEEDLVSLQQNIQRLKQKIQMLHREDWPMAESLEKLAVCMPKKVWLTHLEYQKEGEMVIHGESLEYEQISLWLEGLKQIPGLVSVQLTTLQGERKNQFTLSIEVGGQG